MIGILSNSLYIEKYFPWAVQKYKDKNGDSATSLYGIPVDEASKLNFNSDSIATEKERARNNYYNYWI